MAASGIAREVSSGDAARDITPQMRREISSLKGVESRLKGVELGLNRQASETQGGAEVSTSRREAAPITGQESLADRARRNGRDKVLIIINYTSFTGTKYNNDSSYNTNNNLKKV